MAALLKQNLAHDRYRAIEHAGPARIASTAYKTPFAAPPPRRARVSCAARVAVVQEDAQERAAVLRPERGDHCVFLTARLHDITPNPSRGCLIILSSHMLPSAR